MNTKSIQEILQNKSLFERLAIESFSSVDGDKSGEIDSSELEVIITQLATSMGSEPPNGEEIKEIMNDLDTDNSGKISFDEFKNLIKDVLASMLDDDI